MTTQEVELDTGELCPIEEAAKCASCAKYGVKEDMNECSRCEGLVHSEPECSTSCEKDLHVLCGKCWDGFCPVCRDAAEIDVDDDYSWRHR